MSKKENGETKMKIYEVFTEEKSFRTSSLEYARQMAMKYSNKYEWASIEDGTSVIARYIRGRLRTLSA